jgi:membrane protease YdiL (CAAX protease family)
MKGMEALFEVLDGPMEPSGRVSRAQFLKLSSWFTLVLCLLALFVPLIFQRPGVWSWLAPSGLLTWHTLASGLVGALLSAAVVLIVAHSRTLRAMTSQLLGLVDWSSFTIPDYCAVALLAAVGEELLFRGAMQPVIGLVPAAVIFGLLHATAVAHMVLAGALGVSLGWLFHWTGSLWPPIVAHFIIDLMTALLLARALISRAPPTPGE